jgi:2EXR family
MAATIFEQSGDWYLSKNLMPRPAEKFQVDRFNNDNGMATVRSFLSLPPEIRVDIYKLLLVSNSTISFQHYDYKCGFTCGCNGDFPLAPLRRAQGAGVLNDIHPKILRTCRQVHAEAASILYRDNRFRFACPKDFERFSHDIMPVNAASLRNIGADHSTIDSDIHHFWFFHTQTAVSSTPSLAKFSATFAVQWHSHTPSFFMDALVCMNLLLQTHPRLKRLVLRRQLVHRDPAHGTDIFTLVLVSDDYELKARRCFKAEIDRNSTERNCEIINEAFVDIDAELAILRKPRETPWQIGAGSIFR